MTALFRTEDNFAYHDNGDIECCLCGALVRSSTTHWKWHDRESSSTSASESTERAQFQCEATRTFVHGEVLPCYFVAGHAGLHSFEPNARFYAAADIFEGEPREDWRGPDGWASDSAGSEDAKSSLTNADIQRAVFALLNGENHALSRMDELGDKPQVAALAMVELVVEALGLSVPKASGEDERPQLFKCGVCGEQYIGKPPACARHGRAKPEAVTERSETPGGQR